MLKTRIQLPVTLILAFAVLAILCGDVAAATRPSSGSPSVTASIGVKPVVRPATGEPEGSGNNAPIPKPELVRIGKQLMPELELEDFWEMLAAWFSQVWQAEQLTRRH